MPDSEMDDFAKASPELRFGVLFERNRGVQTRVDQMQKEQKDRNDLVDQQFVLVRNEIKAVGRDTASGIDELGRKLSAALDEQTSQLKPILTQKEIADAIAEKKIKDAKDRRQIWMMIFAGIPALGIIIGGCVTLGAYIIKTEVHVAMPTVEVPPSAAPYATHPSP